MRFFSKGKKIEELKIIIVGAGICGLACGAALREHADVTVRPSPATLVKTSC